MEKVELTSEQKEFLKTHAETIRAIPMRFLVRTSDQCWGVGDNVKEALQNAHASFFTRAIYLSVVDPEQEISDIDGSVFFNIGTHDKEGFAMRDFLSPYDVLDLAGRILRAYDKLHLEERLGDFINKNFESIEGSIPDWETLKDKSNRTII